MSDDPRIQRMAQVIHDARVHIHQDAPKAIKDARGKPTHADLEAAMRIYESPKIRRDLAETNMPDGSDWLAARDARVKAEAWNEGARWAYEEITGEPENRFGLAPGDNPYRAQKGTTDEHH